MAECNEIGKRIANLRAERGISQSVLAKAMFVRRETVAQWEAGTRDIKTEHSIRLADYFGISCDYLLRGIPTENLEIARETGLENRSIEKIKLIAKRMYHDFGHFSLADAMNAFLGSERFMAFVLSFWKFMCKYRDYKEQLDIYDFAWNTEKPKKDPLEHASMAALDLKSDARYSAKAVLNAKKEMDFSLFELQRSLNSITDNYIKEEGKNGKA